MPVWERFSPDGRDVESTGGGEAVEPGSLVKEEEKGTEREEVRDVNRGRMYEKVDCCSGSGAGGGVGARGGGNHVCKDRRARSSVTCRCWVRSALDPTM